jgi:HAD superfamily hydrolase (TIGR01509 family)
MGSRFIDRFEVLLLDMGNTFMFECDDFGADADFWETYRGVGGDRLGAAEVTAVLRGVFARMLAEGRSPASVDRFPSLSSHLERAPEAQGVPRSECELLERVFALHEVGHVSEAHADVLRRLSRSHPLGVVSNIWSRPGAFEAEFGRAGILEVFDVLVWSSVHGCIKPSPRLFRQALDHFGVEPSRAVYVGDHPERDIAGAKAVGMGAVWIENAARPLSLEGPQPDLIVGDLGGLLR